LRIKREEPPADTRANAKHPASLLAGCSFAAKPFLSVGGFIVWRPHCLIQSVIRYYIHAGPAAFRFELAGGLDADDAARLEREWRGAALTIGRRVLVVDMSFVTGIDEAARSLFKRWYARGAEFVAGSRESRELVESITERPYTLETSREPTFQLWFSDTAARGKNESTHPVHSA
jgi:hypothetical protein